MLEKVQPWKSHWPPRERQVEGVEYASKKGEVIIMDGTSAGTSGKGLQVDNVDIVPQENKVGSITALPLLVKRLRKQLIDRYP